MIKRDKLGRYEKGTEAIGRPFVKGQISPNKGRKYKLDHYNLTKEGKIQKIKNLGKYIEKSNNKSMRINYKRIWKDGKQIRYHNFVWCSQPENLSYIPKGFVIHHIDHNKFNNHPDNLFLMSNSDHQRYHRLLKLEVLKRGWSG